jgi:D-serine deaminase-like pyridoxal phosphate-dependent protein
LALDLHSLLEERLDWRFKGFPPEADLRIGELGRPGWRLLGDDLLFPVMVLKAAALESNVEVMAAYCRSRAVELAPHGKTTMAPQIFDLQLRAGAWGLTAATANQVRVYRAVRVPRVLLASQLLDPAAIRWISRELDADPGFEFLSLVDSIAQVSRLQEVLDREGARRPLRVLLEVGVPAGRTGTRSLDQARAVAAAVHRASRLELAGVEGYEGIVGNDREPETIAAVDEYLREVRETVLALALDGRFHGLPEAVVTAGGSAYFDRVVELLTDGWERVGVPVRVVLRSGCYVTHDCCHYERLSPLRGRLEPALELWSRVLSVPEPGRAIASFGKRDAPFDLGLPVPLWLWREPDPTPRASGGLKVTRLNDQHAYLEADEGCDLRPGDLLGCGISHPCTAFDKWQLLPLVDSDYRVLGGIRTYF